VHRIDHVTRAIDANGPGKDGFTGGNPLTSTAPTTVTPDWLNAQQEEIANVITGFGGSLVKAQNNQLAGVLTLALDLLALGSMQQATNPNRARAIANDDEGIGIVAVGGVVNEGTGAVENPIARGYGGLPTSTTIAAVGPFNILHAVGHGNGLFVAAGDGADIRTTPSTSSPGVVTLKNWTRRTPGGGLGGSFRAVHYASSLARWFLGGTGVIQTSVDGITWTGIPLPGGSSAQVTRITSDATYVFAIAGTHVYFSLDGLNWFDGTFDVAPTADLSAVSAVPYGGYLLISSGDATAEGRYGWRSSNGTSWTRQNLTIGALQPEVRIVSRTGLILGQRLLSDDGPGHLAIAVPSGAGYQRNMSTGIVATTGRLVRTNRRWFAVDQLGTIGMSALTLF
jgi:hypothetical protein